MCAEYECDFARIGHKVKDFKFEAYDPVNYSFTEIDLEKLQKEGQWVVLFFYPADFTFVCPTELADLADIDEMLRKMNITVISMSNDTKFAHMAWRGSEKLLENVKYPMGADPTGEIAEYFGVYDYESGTSYRGTFIIDPDGTLVGQEINFNNVGRNSDELMRKMRAFTYVRQNPAEVCPARWKPSDKTLTPSEKIVGNVYDALKK